MIDLFWPRVIISSKVFQVVFVYLIYISALFMASSCCSLLCHVGANWICIVYVSHQQGSIFKTSRIYSFFLWTKRAYPAVLKIFISMYFNSFFYPSPSKFCFHIKERRASALYAFIVENFWIKVGVRVLIGITSI